MLFPGLEVNSSCQAYPLELFQYYFMLFVLLTTEFFWEDWGVRANLSRSWWLCDLAGSWCAIAQGNLPAFLSAIPKPADQNDLCLWFDGERKAKTNPPLPTQPSIHPNSWRLIPSFPDGLALQTDSVCRVGGSFLKKEGVFCVHSPSKRLQTWGDNCWFWVTLTDGIKTIFKFTAL